LTDSAYYEIDSLYIPILGFLSRLLNDGNLKPPFPLVFKLPDSSGLFISALPDVSNSPDGRVWLPSATKKL